jgi:hypothetical protein
VRWPGRRATRWRLFGTTTRGDSIDRSIASARLPPMTISKWPSTSPLRSHPLTLCHRAPGGGRRPILADDVTVRGPRTAIAAGGRSCRLRSRVGVAGGHEGDVDDRALGMAQRGQGAPAGQPGALEVDGDAAAPGRDERGRMNAVNGTAERPCRCRSRGAGSRPVNSESCRSPLRPSPTGTRCDPWREGISAIGTGHFG